MIAGLGHIDALAGADVGLPESFTCAAQGLGGVGMLGGVEGVGGTVSGALIIGVLSNGLNLLRVSSCCQAIIQGAVIILAVMLDLATKWRR